MNKQKTIGVGISYFNTALSMFSHLIFIPMLISHLTDNDYGIYKVMQSFAGPLIMFNMGLSTVAARCIAKFKVSNDDVKEKQNTLALIAIIGTTMAMAVFIIGLVMMGSIDFIFGKTYTEENLITAKKVFILFVSSTAVYIIKDVFRGCVLGNEKFIFYYGSLTLQTLLRFAFIGSMIFLDFDVIAISSIDLLNGLILTALNFVYVKFRLREKFKLYKINKVEVISIFSFSVSILLQAIINQVNNNLDNVILGATISNAQTITMYSSALSIMSTYNSILSALISMFLPKATALITKKATGEELTNFVIKGERMQVALALAVICGFAVLGRDFISLWIGEKYITAYYVVLIIIIPATVPLVENVCLSILDAKLKRMFRSVTLVLMALINVVLSLILLNYLGFWGAAIGTAVSMIIGDGIIINIYYQKVIKLNVFRMFKEMFRGFLPATILTFLCCIPLMLLPGTLMWFILKALILVAVYVIWTWLLGFNKEEKELVFGVFNRFRKNKNN